MAFYQALYVHCTLEKTVANSINSLDLSITVSDKLAILKRGQNNSYSKPTEIYGAFILWINLKYK